MGGEGETGVRGNDVLRRCMSAVQEQEEAAQAG